MMQSARCGALLGALLALLAPASAALVPGHVAAAAPADEDLYALPDGLLIGAGVSAVQTEGAWNEDGKSESAADHVIHTGRLGSAKFSDDTTLHDTAADSYHLYKQDVAMAAKLKLTMFRFSFSWSRVLPTADATKPNLKGVEYYHNLIDEIIANGMVPLGTLYHFDHPQILEDQFKGWQDQKMVMKFKEYAAFIFKEYSSKVKLWATFNEPNLYCVYFPSLFHAAGLYADADINPYTCMRNTILAHAEAYHDFRDAGFDGKVGFTALIMHAKPNSTSAEDVYAADAFNELYTGQVLNPVVHGDYPQVVKDLAGGLLTPFSAQEQASIKGTTDFIGLNVYYQMVAAYTDTSQNPSNPLGSLPMLSTLLDQLPFLSLAVANSDSTNIQAMFSSINPDAISSAVMWLWRKYKLPLLITENGYGEMMGQGKRDHERAVYHSVFLRRLVVTMKKYDVKVLGYCVWSLIDSFEWSAGFSRPFGLVHVHYEGKTLERSLKDSAQFWIDMRATKVVPYVAPAATPSSATAGATAAPLLLAALLLAEAARLAAR